MKTSSLIQLGCTFLIFGSSVSAWPWPSGWEGILVRRQNSGGSSTSSSASSSPSPTASRTTSGSNSEGSISSTPSRTSSGNERSGSSSSGSPTSGGNNESPSPTSSGDSPSSSGSQNNSDNNNNNNTSASSTIDIDPRLPPGGIQMITPAPIAGRQYYKIGDNVTFAWNYTSLSVTPSAIDILASCSLNQATYTIASNQSVQSAQSLVWDTRKEKTGSAPLPMATYTLLVYDAAQGPSATPSSGYLSSSNNFQFYMYNPREYEPLDQFKCASCSGAMSSRMGNDNKNALKFALGMMMLTILSFGWFLGGAL